MDAIPDSQEAVEPDPDPDHDHNHNHNLVLEVEQQHLESVELNLNNFLVTLSGLFNKIALGQLL